MRIAPVLLALAALCAPAAAELPPGPNPWVGGTLAAAVGAFGPPLLAYYEPSGAQVFVWPGSPPAYGRGGFADPDCSTEAVARGMGLALSGWTIVEVRLRGAACN
jgi:hypothetical protein